MTVAPISLQSLEWIAVDWGTSHLRVWAMDRQQGVLASAESGSGMARLADGGDYEQALLALVAEWLPLRVEQPVPVFICGMAGARQGWQEAGYRKLPCEPLINQGLTEVKTRDIRLKVFIAPGLCQRDPVDVMRGEETQLAGLLTRTGSARASVCLPGTHSKWVQLNDAQVLRIKTFMTGELFALLSQQSTLKYALADDELDLAEFHRSVDDSMRHSADISNQLFSIRARALVSGLDRAAARARLSGLLIGLELAATRDQWLEQAVHLIGDEKLTTLYAAALTELGATPMVQEADSLVISGLAGLYQAYQQENVA